MDFVDFILTRDNDLSDRVSTIQNRKSLPCYHFKPINRGKPNYYHIISDESMRFN